MTIGKKTPSRRDKVGHTTKYYIYVKHCATVFTVLLSNVMLNVIMLSALMLIAVII
jgi:hypothetical protein